MLPFRALARPETHHGHDPVFEIGGALAFEAPGSEDVATYVFGAGPDPAARVRGLCHAFAAVGFRREPIHLSEEALGAGAHARYRELVALVPAVRGARAAFLGRAVHASLEAWTSALDAALARAAAAAGDATGGVGYPPPPCPRSISPAPWTSPAAPRRPAPPPRWPTSAAACAWRRSRTARP